MRVLPFRAARGGGEACGGIGCHLELRLARQDADAPDLLARHVAAAAQEGQQPFRVGPPVAPDIHAEPHAFLRAAARARGGSIARRAGGGAE